MSDDEDTHVCETAGHLWIDDDRGHYCSVCGKFEVATDNFERTVEFIDMGGIGERQGTFVSHESQTGFGTPGHSGQRRLLTVKGLIQNLVLQVGALPDLMVDKAYRIFKLADRGNFVRGRKTQLVVASCLYIACRLEDKPLPFMLIDFSDILQINVFELGKMFLKLRKALCKEGSDPFWRKLKAVDPSFFIERFAEQLDFGEKVQVVRHTANLLTKRMKRDWIITGRRPAGICGAALLISSRLHGFRRTQKEIARVVHICDMTIRKRLNEFAETPASLLTHAEFEAIDFEDIESADPPSFTRLRENEKLPSNKVSKIPVVLKKVKSAALDPETELRPIEEDIQSALQSTFADAEKISNLKAIDELPAINLSIYKKELNKMQAFPFLSEDGDADSARNGGHGGYDGPPIKRAAFSSAFDPTSYDAIGMDYMNEFEEDFNFDDEMGELEDGNDNDHPIKAEAEEEEISDWEEVDEFIIHNEEEMEHRKALWEEINKEYIEKQKIEKAEPGNQKKPRKRKKQRTSFRMRAVSAAEAIGNELQRKGFSKKIKYSNEELEGLFET